MLRDLSWEVLAFPRHDAVKRTGRAAEVWFDSSFSGQQICLGFFADGSCMGGLTLGIKENHGWWPNILSGPWTSKYTWYIIIYPGFILDQTFEIRLPNNEQIQIDMVKWSRVRNRYAQDVGYWNAARIQCTVRNPKTLVAFDATFCCQMKSIFGLFFWISWASWTSYFAESLWQRH